MRHGAAVGATKRSGRRRGGWGIRQGRVRGRGRTAPRGQSRHTNGPDRCRYHSLGRGSLPRLPRLAPEGQRERAAQQRCRRRARKQLPRRWGPGVGGRQDAQSLKLASLSMEGGEPSLEGLLECQEMPHVREPQKGRALPLGDVARHHGARRVLDHFDDGVRPTHPRYDGHVARVSLLHRCGDVLAVHGGQQPQPCEVFEPMEHVSEEVLLHAMERRVGSRCARLARVQHRNHVRVHLGHDVLRYVEQLAQPTAWDVCCEGSVDELEGLLLELLYLAVGTLHEQLGRVHHRGQRARRMHGRPYEHMRRRQMVEQQRLFAHTALARAHRDVDVCNAPRARKRLFEGHVAVIATAAVRELVVLDEAAVAHVVE